MEGGAGLRHGESDFGRLMRLVRELQGERDVDEGFGADPAAFRKGGVVLAVDGRRCGGVETGGA